MLQIYFELNAYRTFAMAMVILLPFGDNCLSYCCRVVFTFTHVFLKYYVRKLKSQTHKNKFMLEPSTSYKKYIVRIFSLIIMSLMDRVRGKIGHSKTQDL